MYKEIIDQAAFEKPSSNRLEAVNGAQAANELPGAQEAKGPVLGRSPAYFAVN